MRIFKIAILLQILVSCSVSNKEETATEPLTRIQQSSKHVFGEDAFPLMNRSLDTIKSGEPLVKLVCLNSKMFQSIADYESLELSYKIAIHHRNSWDSRVEIDPSDTMLITLYFDSLNLKPDSLHKWYFTTTAKFDRDGKFFYDTTFMYENGVLIKD